MIQMNKKGFTLVELLAVMVILIALSLVVVPGIFTMIKKAKDNSYEVIIGTIENSARLYVNRNREDVESYLDFYNYYSMTLNDLKDNKLIKKGIRNPRTDEVLDYNKKVIVTREEDKSLSICFEDRGCYIPTLLVNELTKEGNVVSGTTQGLHYNYLKDFYYFRGANPNNWILFNGYLWKIVKVNNDGTIKLMFEGTKTSSGTQQNGTISNTTFDDNNINNFDTNISIKTNLQNWYDSSISTSNKSKIKSINWCVNQIGYNIDGTPIETFSNDECNVKTTTTSQIGLLSGSEYLNASLDSYCITAYRTTGDNGYTCKNDNYLYKSSYSYWSITPDATANGVWGIKSSGSLGAPISANNTMNVRPVINLINGVIVDKGTGTFDNPYTIKNIVTADKEKPIITILGKNPATHTVGNQYVDAGATAIDNVDGNITNSIMTVSNVNPNVIGNYTVTYIVSDKSGNKSTRTRIVNVIPPTFACGSTLVDDRDGEQYATVQIGNQCWFKGNLKHVGNGCTSNMWDDVAPHNACQTHSTDWGTEVLYQWEAAMDGSTVEGARGLCPSGWYIPTDNDLKELEMHLGMTQAQVDATGWIGTDQGDQLKSTNPNWCNDITNCAISSFEALPSGTRNASGTHNFGGTYGHWWSSTPYGAGAWRRTLYSLNSSVNRNTSLRYYGDSVRCIKE